MSDLCIEFCRDNVDEPTRLWLRRVGQRLQIEINEDICLGHCGECDKTKFLLVEGKAVQGSSHHQILEWVLQIELPEAEDE